MSLPQYHKPYLEKQICDALKLENVISLDIHLEVGSAPTLNVSRFIEDEELTKLISIFQRCELSVKETWKGEEMSTETNIGINKIGPLDINYLKTCDRYMAEVIVADKLNEVIENQNKIINYLDKEGKK